LYLVSTFLNFSNIYCKCLYLLSKYGLYQFLFIGKVSSSNRNISVQPFNNSKHLFLAFATPALSSNLKSEFGKGISDWSSTTTILKESGENFFILSMACRALSLLFLVVMPIPTLFLSPTLSYLSR